MHRKERDSDSHVRGRGMIGREMQSRTLDLSKLRLGWSSAHFVYMEHASDAGDLCGDDMQGSVR